MDYVSLTFDIVIKALAVLIIIYEAFKKIMEIKKDSDKDHERKQGWDYAAKVIKEKEDKWDKGLADVYDERNKIVELYNARLDELDARTQQLYSMLVMVIRSVNAILEGQIESGANGDVKKMHSELNNFITEQIGK